MIHMNASSAETFNLQRRNIGITLIFLISLTSSVHAGLSLRPENPITVQPITLQSGEEPLPLVPRVVNFVSGVPLVSYQDATGGFGDIAANALGAIEFKRRNPSVTVNLIVTSFKNNQTSQMMTTEQILKIMFPDLQPEHPDRPQSVQGVNVIYLREDANSLIFGNPDPELNRSLSQQIPHADLSIQLSANESAARHVLRSNSRVSFSFDEMGGGESLLRHNSKSSVRPSGTSTDLIPLRAGARAMGIYLEERMDEDDQAIADHEVISRWLRGRRDNPLAPGSDLIFAYTKEAASTAFYVEAIAQIATQNPSTQYTLITKDFERLTEVTLPSNVRHIVSKSFPHAVMKSLISQSTYSPIVTGDSSVSLAIGSVHAGKTFIYEAPRWKRESSDAFKTMLAESAGINEAILEPMFMNFVPHPTHQRAENLAALVKTLTDRELQSKLSQALQTLRPRMDFQANVLKMFQLYRLYQTEWNSGIMSLQFFEFAARLWVSSASHTDLSASMKQMLFQIEAGAEAKAVSTFLRLKLRQSFDQREVHLAWNALVSMSDKNFVNKLAPLLAAMIDQENTRIFLQAGLHSEDSKVSQLANEMAQILVTKVPEVANRMQMIRESSPATLHPRNLRSGLRCEIFLD